MFKVSKTLPIIKEPLWEVNPRLRVETRNLNNWEGDNTLSLAP